MIFLLIVLLIVIGVFIVILCALASERTPSRSFLYNGIAMIVAVATIIAVVLLISSKEEPEPEHASPYMDEDDMYAACEYRAARYGYESGTGCDP